MARMHAAAVGSVRGPIVGPVEDVLAVAEKLAAAQLEIVSWRESIKTVIKIAEGSTIEFDNGASMKLAPSPRKAAQVLTEMLEVPTVAAPLIAALKSASINLEAASDFARGFEGRGAVELSRAINAAIAALRYSVSK